MLYCAPSANRKDSPMQASLSTPARQRLVLLGGGHSHLAVLMYLAKNPLPGLEICLVSRDIETPYSGALPAYITGKASAHDLFIDLRPLAQMAGVRLIQSQVHDIDLAEKRLHCPGRPALGFDFLSINIGSAPAAHRIPGALDCAVAIKPIPAFLAHWERIQADAVARCALGNTYTLAIVGGGPASVEMACAMQERLLARISQAGGDGACLRVHLLSRAKAPLATHSRAAQSLAVDSLTASGISLHTECTVNSLTPGQLHFVRRGAAADTEEILAFDACIIATGAAAAPWLQHTGLALDAAGFILVNDCLQSLSHPFVFAAGDSASIAGQQRPKSGVYAVRQGMPLAKNLRRYALGQPLRSYSPQKQALALLNMTHDSAIASRGAWALQGRWISRWKTWIDRRFVAKYRDLPDPGRDDANLAADAPLGHTAAAPLRCSGCAAKLESGMLARVLGELHSVDHADVEASLHSAEDCAIIRVEPQRLLLQTVDHLRSFIDDPYVFARIASNHCLSDIHAMGASAHSALAIVGIPFAAPAIMEDQLREVMTACTEVLNAHDTALIGGHTSETESLSLGLSINAFTAPDTLLRKTGMQAGDVLILTKAIGTGVLFAADMRYRARHAWIAPALEQMQQSNQLAAQVFVRHKAHACTDITGFGLLGHLREMLTAASVEVALNLAALPVLDGALACFAQGIFSSLHADNARQASVVTNLAAYMQQPRLPLLFDPQTAGGLLAAVPAAVAEHCLADLHASGYRAAVCIGTVSAAQEWPGRVTLCDQPLPEACSADAALTV